MKFYLAPSRSIRIALAGLLLMLAVQTASAKDNWLNVRSRNFNLIGNCSEADLRKVATRLEQFRDVFTRLFPAAKFETPVPTTVIVFKSLSSYKPFNPGGNAGYFQKGEDVNYITMTTELGAQNPYNVIYHEYVHLLVDNTSGNMPAFFDEGLAEYYSTFSVEEDRKAHLGELIPYHLMTLREERLLPLRTLFAVDRYSPHYNESGKRGVFYAESWALMHYLILGNKGERRPQVGNFLGLLNANVPAEEAVKQAFQTDIETLEKELKRYIEGHNFQMQVATFEHKLEYDSELQTSPVPEAQAQAYLGDLLLHTHHLTEAEALLQQALALDPTLTMAQASLGIVRVRQNRLPEARQLLSSAVAGNSQNYLAHYYYAYALSREGMDSNTYVQAYAPETAATIRDELNHAIQLNPTFPESYVLLAFVNTVTGERLDQAIAQLKRAMQLAPGRQELSVQLAQVYLRQQKFDLAKQVLEPLRTAKDRRVVKQAEGLLDSIKRYEERLTAYSSRNEPQSGTPKLQERSTVVTSAPQVEEPEKTESDYLQETLRPVEAGEQRIQGLFTKLECDSKGVAYFLIQAGDRLYRVRATALGRVQLTAYVEGASDLGCGVRKQPENVVFTFRPATDAKDAKAKIDGDAVAMELVPKDFKLKN
jgi:tetratricopeptide (TPR) repeat protein